MVDVAQLVEPRIVDPVVVGSSPIVHPTLQAAEKGLTFAARIRAISSIGRAADS